MNLYILLNELSTKFFTIVSKLKCYDFLRNNFSLKNNFNIFGFMQL